MSFEGNYEEIRRVREASAAWRLLAADNGAFVVITLKTLLFDDRAQRTLPGSVMEVRVDDALERLRERGQDFPRNSRYYLGRWVADGYLIRRLAMGADEEEYELSAASIDAIRFVDGLARPLPTMTESHLALVIQAVARLSDDTDADQGRRIASLHEDIARRQEELKAIESGRLPILEPAAAIERAREIVAQAEGLVEDFRRVMDQFESLSRDFRGRAHLMGEPRGGVLDQFFKDYGSLERTDAGRTFAAFYNLLNDDVQQSILSQSLARIRAQEFFGRLEERERRLLNNLVGDLLEQATAVSKVTMALDESLRRFVAGPERVRSREMARLLDRAKASALALKDQLKWSGRLKTVLNLSHRKFRSVSQLVWRPERERVPPEPFREAEGAGVDLDEIREAVVLSEIDFRTLKENVLAVLAERERASVVDVLDRFPAVQGLASLIGLIHLAHRHGEKAGEGRETAEWTGLDGTGRSSRIDRWLFFRERADELRETPDEPR